MLEILGLFFKWLASRDYSEDEDAKDEERRAKGAGVPRRDFWDEEDEAP